MNVTKNTLRFLLFFSFSLFLNGFLSRATFAQDCNQLDFVYKQLSCLEPPYIVEFIADTLGIFPPGASYNWNITDAQGNNISTGNGNPFNAILPTFGIYHACVKAHLPNGTECTKCKDLAVLLPMIDFTAPIIDRALCQTPHISTFTIQNPMQFSGCTFTWKIYQSASSTPSAVLGPFNEAICTYNFTEENCYDIEVIANCPGGCSPSKKKIKYVVATAPIADVLLDDTTYCTGEKVCPMYTGTQIGCPLAFTFQWKLSKNDGPFTLWSNEENPCKPINEPGTYRLSLTVSNFEMCPSTFITGPFTVAPILLSATVQNPTCGSCPNGKITATASNGAAPYQYKLGAGAYQSASTFTGLTPGAYTVSVMDAGGCTNSISVTLYNSANCPAPANLSATSGAPGAYLISWNAVPSAVNYNLRYKPVSASNWTTFTVNGLYRQLTGLSAQEQYEVQVRAVCFGIGAGAYSASLNFSGANAQCNAPVIPTVSAITPTSAKFTWPPVSGATSYQIQYRRVTSGTWQTLTAPQTPFTITGLAAGVQYYARVRSVCNNVTSLWSGAVLFKTLVGRLGEENLVLDENAPFFQIYPNPTAGQFTLEFNEEIAETKQIIVSDVVGRKVWETRLENAPNETEIPFDLSGYSPGVYLLEIRIREQSFFTKVVIR